MLQIILLKAAENKPLLFERNEERTWKICYDDLNTE